MSQKKYGPLTEGEKKVIEALAKAAAREDHEKVTSQKIMGRPKKRRLESRK